MREKNGNLPSQKYYGGPGWLECIVYYMKHILLLWEGDCPELKLDLRGLGINEFLFFQDFDVSSVFSHCHWLSCWCSFNHIWTVGVRIQMCFCIASTEDLFWGSPVLGEVRGSAAFSPEAQSAFLLDQPGLSLGILWHCPLQAEPSHIFVWIAAGCTCIAILTHVKLLSQAECLHTHLFNERA